MDSHVQFLLIILIVLIMFSAFFSATETAFSCSNRIRLKNMLNNGNKTAGRVLKQLDNYDNLISTILIGNNIVNIASATIATVIFTKIYGDTGASISTLVMTIVVLIFGEITPKSMAKENPEQFAMFSSSFIQVLIVIFVPLNILFTCWKNLIKKLFKFKQEDTDTQDELLTMVEEAESEGNLEAHESDLISAAIEFNDLDVKDILTPRVDLIAVDIKSPLNEIEKVFRFNSFSRLPVYENSIDNIVGFIHEKDFYNLYYNEKGQLKSIIKTLIFTNLHVKISGLLKQLQSSKTHMAIVLDEYGGTSGIITLEDILEELVGDIWDEHDVVVEYYKQLSDNVYLVECDAELEDMFERFDVRTEEEFEMITVSGWVIHKLEHIPTIGEKFSYMNLDIEVTRSDARKVIEVQVTVNEIVDEDEKEKKKTSKGFFVE
ncbi:HlyC/CorC family transporter [Anaerorhabdus sp.]|uniref:HlyC/CorC family transporter n=1 Tax=Anaerorhabdus sp. TaxID=1872524 RepID=UPI002FCB5067